MERLINGVVSNGADAVTVNLRCVAAEICETPATVTIPAGQSRAYINVGGLELGSTQIEASAAGMDAVYINAETVAATLRLQSVPSSLKTGQKATSIHVSAEVPGAYWATNQYPSVPVTITFTSSVPSVGTITDSVTWNANSGNSGYATFTAVAPGTIPVSVAVTQSGQGGLSFHATDLFTETLDAGGKPIPGVANVRIRLQNDAVLTYLRTLTTDAQGKAVLTDLP
ncbi:MAG: hypothetical protein LBJ40_07295, partial [Delftia acidovorans]|nr:hypothetical protein [Delftia acidovorans]